MLEPVGLLVDVRPVVVQPFGEKRLVQPVVPEDLEGDDSPSSVSVTPWYSSRRTSPRSSRVFSMLETVGAVTSRASASAEVLTRSSPSPWIAYIALM